MKSQITLDNGKYTIIEDLDNGRFKCLRYGEEWRSLIGDGMILSMFCRIQELESCLIQIHEEILNGDTDREKILEYIDETI